MADAARKRDTGCPCTYTLDVIGDRWSVVIIRDMFQGRSTFSEFLAAEEQIATNVLTDRLRALEANGIITRARDAANKRRVIYSLTEKGADLCPVMLEMVRWGAKYDPDTMARKDILKRLEEDRDGLIADFKSAALDVQ